MLALSGSYPSFLKCYIDLDDEEEVIMNNLVVPPENAEHNVQILVSIDNGETWMDDEIFFSPEKETVVQVKLEIPEALRHSDFQYVLELQGSKNAKFQNGHCEGRRVYGKLRQVATIVIEEFTQEKESVDEIEIFAGWATGHEAVTRTSSVYLDPEEEQEL